MSVAAISFMAEVGVMLLLVKGTHDTNTLIM